MRFIARPVTQGACVVPDNVLCFAAQRGVKSKTLVNSADFHFYGRRRRRRRRGPPDERTRKTLFPFLRESAYGWQWWGFDREKTGWGSGGR